MADTAFPSNDLVKGYRKFLESRGKVDPRPDLELTLELGNLLKSQGGDAAFDAKAEQYPDFRDQYLEASQATDRGYLGELYAGAKRGVEGLGATGLGLVALGAKAVGATETSKSIADKARELEADSESAPTVGRMKDVNTVGGGVRYGLGKIGEAIPNIAEALLTSMAGAAVGTAAEPGGGTVAGAVGGLIGKNAIKQMIRKGIGKELGEVGLEQALRAGASKELQAAFVGEARNVAQRMGGEAAGYLNAAALGAGGTFNATDDVGASLGAGAFGGAAGALLPGHIVSKYFAAESPAGTFMARLARGLPKDLAIGTAGTVGQELANLTAEKIARGEPATLTDADIERLKESAVGGAIGGAIAAPLGASHAESPSIEARRRAATGDVVTPPAPPVPVESRVKTRGEVLRDALTMAPADQDARAMALEKLATRTKDEDGELAVLQAVIAQRPSGTANTTVPPPAPPAPVVPAAPVAVSPSVTPTVPPVAPVTPAPDVVAPAATPVPPAAPVATPVEPPAVGALRRRIQDVGKQLGGIVTQAPTVDASEVIKQFEAISKQGFVTGKDVTTLETSIADLQKAATAEAARLALERATQKQTLAAAKDAKLKAAADRAAARIQKIADAAAKKIPAEPVAEEVTAPPAEPVLPGAPTADEVKPGLPDVTPQLEAVLNPKLEAGPIKAGGDGGAELADVLSDVLAGRESKRTGLFQSDTSGPARTRTAVTLLLPDGRVVQTGLLPERGLMKIGDAKGAKVYGPAVQRMSDRAQAGKAKALTVGGRDPALLTDVIKSGAKVIDTVSFDMNPGEIYQEFPNEAAYREAVKGTERKAQSVKPDERVTLDQAEQSGAAEEGRTADEVTRQQKLEDALGEFPKDLDAIVTRALNGTSDALDRLPKLTRERVERVLADAGASRADLTEFLDRKVAALNAETPTPKTPAPGVVAPAPEQVAKPAPAPTPAATKAETVKVEGKLSAALGKNRAFGERLFNLINRGGGTFDEDFLAKMSEANRDAILTALDKSGVEWGDFSSAVQTAFNNSNGSAVTFTGILKASKLRDPAEQASRATVRATLFDSLVNRLRQNGFNIDLIKAEMGQTERATFTDDGRIVVAMHDVTNASMENLVGLIHEVGHAQVDKLGGDARQRLSAAVDRTILTVKDGRLIEAAKNANLNWEEKLVETLAIKLGEQGLTEPGLAARVWQAVKDLYTRTAMLLLGARGITPSDEHVISWFEANLRRELGASYDLRFADLFRPFIERSYERVSRFTVIDGQDIPNLLDRTTGQVMRAEVLPDSSDAALWNLDRGGARFRDPKAELDLSYVEGMARIQGAGWGELMPAIMQLKKDIGAGMTEGQFWAIFSRGDLPADIISRLEERVPGAGAAKIGGEKMTESMNAQARYHAFRLAQALAYIARKRAATDENTIARHTDNLVSAAKKVTKTEREHRSFAELDTIFKDELRDLVKETARDLDRGPDTAFAAGELLGAIRAVERLAPDEPIPAHYQSVFKVLLDGGGESIIDHMRAIAKLDLPGRMSAAEVVAAIKANAAGDPRLKSLAEQRPLMVALATLAQKSAREMDLLRLSTLRDTAEYFSIKAELDEIRTASEARIEEIAKGIDATSQNQTLRDRLRQKYLDARREFNAAQRGIKKATERQTMRTAFADAMAKKGVELSRDVGAFSSWEATNKATYTAMQRDEAGAWTAVPRQLAMIGDEITQQHDRVANDLQMNRIWLEANKADAGTRLYEEVQRQTAQLQLLDFSKIRQASHRFWFDKFLLPLADKYAGTGQLPGVKIKQMLTHWQHVMFSNGDPLDAASHRWDKALQETADAAGYSHPINFFREVMSNVLYQIESDPGRDAAASLREAKRMADRLVPDGFKKADNFHDKLETLLRTHKELSEGLNTIAEHEGVFVGDQRVRDPLTGKGNLMRHAIKYGWFTSPRRLNSELVRTLIHDMQGKGWHDKLFSDLSAEATDQEIAALSAKYFPPSVVREFVTPFVMKPGKEVFFGALDKNERPRFVSQLDAQLAWADADASVPKFIDLMFDRTNQGNDRSGLGAYRVSMLQRFAEMYRMESKLAAKSEKPADPFNPHAGKAHTVMDARTNDLIPPEHFSYEMFNSIDTRRKLTNIAFHAAFGRDGKGLDGAMGDLDASLKQASDRYKLLPKGSKKERADFATAQGWGDLKKLERAAADARDSRTWQRKLVAHFTGSEAVVGDARSILELAQLNMSLVLNQPKSGLWNLLTLFDYPLVYRGLNKTSVRATGTAAAVFARETAHAFLHVFGINFLQATEHAAEIGEAVERRQTSQLPLSTLLADMGPGGKFADGGVANRVTQVSRGIQNVMRKGFRGNNAMWAPFAFISNKLDTGIATANVKALEMIVRRGMDFFESHPEARDNPAYRFTASDLGMKGAWFSDESAFHYFRERTLEYGLGNLEQIARDAGKEGARLLTRDQALGAAMMGLNEISLMSNVNTRPVEMIDNPVLRLGGLMLGWPLAKMNQVHRAFTTPEGQLTLGSALKTLGVMASWSLPAGLAYSLLMDEYDDKFLNKKSNMRHIDPVALTPIVGLPLAALQDKRNILGAFERLARAGTYGLAGDAVNSIANWVDPTSGQRDFDLNSRVLVFSQFANFRDTLRNFIHQDGAYTYDSVGRPLLSAMGGGGVIQAMQLVNNALGLTNAESEATNRINVSNWLRAAGRDADLELKAGGGRSSPTEFSVWTNEMRTAALANDRPRFLEAYRHAVDVSRARGDEDPEAKVLEGFKARNPMESVFRTKPDDAALAKLFAAMDDTGRQVVQQAMSRFDMYEEMIAPSPIERRLKQMEKTQMRAMTPPTLEQLRRRTASAALAF